MHANEQKGRLPERLDEVLKLDVAPQVFVNPRSSTSLPTGLQGAALARWVNESSDYVYLGAGLNHRTATPETVIAHEKPDGLEDGLNLLYGDGHVEFQNMDAAIEQIQKAQARPRGKAGPGQGI
jgi:prepilin-type processing-associated H-X9-DG protein